MIILREHTLFFAKDIVIMFLNYNFSKEQSMLPEDDRMIERCRRVLSVLILNFRSLNDYMRICWCIN